MFGKGLHTIVDGQFGSTGKGLLASYLAVKAADMGVEFKGVVSNAGPNSGHTSYFKGRKIVLKQLPTFAVINHLMGIKTPVYLSAGAIIDPTTLAEEIAAFPDIEVYVHPQAAIISRDDVNSEHSGSIAAVAGTRKGVGAALARKVNRQPSAVASSNKALILATGAIVLDFTRTIQKDLISGHNLFMEISQGFSLGINSEFYPKVTSRECTVMQGLADARIAPEHSAMVYMSARTFPIRVGNFDGHHSGGHYYDQEELTWDDVGVPPELTTVTLRERRVFSFSEKQIQEAMWANMPDVVFLNFCNYLTEDRARAIMDKIRWLSPKQPITILSGWGPDIKDVKHEG